jgi:hypothetical protein
MQAYEEFQREKRMVDDIIAKIMEEERLEQMEKMKKRNESVEMMRQVSTAVAPAVVTVGLACDLLTIVLVHGGP